MHFLRSSFDHFCILTSIVHETDSVPKIMHINQVTSQVNLTKFEFGLSVRLLGKAFLVPYVKLELAEALLSPPTLVFQEKKDQVLMALTTCDLFAIAFYLGVFFFSLSFCRTFFTFPSAGCSFNINYVLFWL